MLRRFLIPLLLAVPAACSQPAHNDAALAHAKVGAPAPAFDEPKLGGGTLAMSSLVGKPVYLNFFASWCGPCNDEAPDLSAVASEFKPDGLQVIGVDVLESAKKAQQFVAEHHVLYPAVVDDGTLRDAYRINGMPVHVFIARDGTVKKIVVGQLSKAEMIAGVKAIL